MKWDLTHRKASILAIFLRNLTFVIILFIFHYFCSQNDARQTLATKSLATRSWLPDPGYHILTTQELKMNLEKFALESPPRNLRGGWPGSSSASGCSWLLDLGYQILAIRSWIPDPGYQFLATRTGLPDPGSEILEKLALGVISAPPSRRVARLFVC